MRIATVTRAVRLDKLDTMTKRIVAAGSVLLAAVVAAFGLIPQLRSKLPWVQKEEDEN